MELSHLNPSKTQVHESHARMFIVYNVREASIYVAKIQYVQKIKITDARSTAGCFRITTGSLSDHKKKLFILTLLRPLV